MGYGTDEGLTWTDRLGDAIGEPVYNMGVSGTGPGTQLMLLEHVLNDKAKASCRQETIVDALRRQ